MAVKKIIAVYKITNTVNGKVYIGSTVDYKTRVSKHKSDLRAGKHCNEYLQRSWSKNGEELFSFTIIEIVDTVAEVSKREQYWIDLSKASNREFGYNLKEIAYSNIGYKFSEESKMRMSYAKKGKPWTERQRIAYSSIKRTKRPHMTGVNNTLSVPIIQYDLKMKQIKEWDSINLCSVFTGLHKSGIISCLKGRIRKTGGFIFRYK